jgi:phage-related protein
MAIKIPIITIFDNKGLRAAQYQLNKVSKNMGALTRNFQVAGIAIGAFAIGMGSAVKAASNFEAEFEGVNQVFGEAAQSVQAFANAAAATAGLSATEALRAAKTFGLFANSAGLSTEQSAKFSTSLVQLAGDLGSFNDVPTEEALAAIQSGLMGQAEPLRKFGVFLTDNALRAEAMALKIYEGTGALSDQQKMMAAYSLIFKKTTIQQGDFVKYQDTFGNQIKIVSAEFQNLSVRIGNILLPILASLLPTIRTLSNEFGSKLKTALESVDWKSLLGALVNLITFLVQNIEVIGKTAAALLIHS